MSNNDSFSSIWSTLQKCKRVAMTLHYSPDGDSLGSCAAMKYVLERDLDCEVVLVSYDPLEENLAALPYAKEVIFGKDISDLDFHSFDAIVCLDAGSPDMLSGKLKKEFVLPKHSKIIQIDHHKTNSYYGTMNYVIPSPSACSVLVDFFLSSGVTFDSELSTRLLLGICTDTGFFAYNASPGIAFEQAAFLINHGADYYNSISKPLRFSESLKMKKFLSLVVNNIIVNEKLRFAYSTVSLKDSTSLGLNSSELRGAVRAIQDLKDIDFVFVLVELPGLIKGSFRSPVNVDVSIFATALGGGGHKPAAAFQLPNVSLRDAEKKVLDVIKRLGVQTY